MVLMLRVIGFWLLLLSATLGQTLPPIGTGSISGKVTIEGKGAPNVIVRIQKSDEQWNSSKPPTTVTTDADGVFKLEKLPAAQYVIAPSAPGFYNPLKKSEWQEGMFVNLGDGEHVTGQDFALKRGAVVTGRLFDANGRAIIEQSIVLKKTGANAKGQIITCSEISDDRGIYRCYGLEPGKYIVGAGNDPKENPYPVLGRASYVRTWYPGVAQEDQATPLEITVEKETSGIDLKLERKKKGVRVMGRVFDAETGKPVPNVAIALGTVNDSGIISGYSIGGGSGSNAEGEFKIEGITKGKYRAIPRSWESSEYYGDIEMFEVGDADVTGLEIKMHKGAVIQGAVALEDGSPPEAQRKVQGITLTATVRGLNANDTDWYASTNSSSGVDAAGNVQFKGLSAGNVTFGLSRQSAEGFSIARIERDGASLTDRLAVRGGETVTGLRIVLAQGSGKIRGEIKVEGGTLPEDVSLRIQAKATSKTQNDGYGSIDARGKFLIEYLSSGSYDLVVETVANRPPYGKPSVTLQANTKNVQVTNGQETPASLTVTIGNTNKEEK